MSKYPLKLSEFDYDLPKELIAQYPVSPRHSCRLLVLERKSAKIKHYKFSDITEFLHPGDILVLNDTSVLSCRLIGHRITGGKVEVFLLRRNEAGEFNTLIRPSRLKTGEEIVFNNGKIRGKLLSRNSIVFNLKNPDHIYQYGEVPLPPYLKRDTQISDVSDYQTVYAKRPGAVASPTAGLHFTEGLLSEIARQGIKLSFITLHTGYGTFRKIRCQEIEEHKMEEEYFVLSPGALKEINEKKDKGNRVIAVGTTVSRALETYATLGRQEGYTNLFIYPGYKFKMVDCLVTNFHLPRSSLFLLVCAFAGKDLMMQAYNEAIKKSYRFYSYGDAMLII
ncbi:MAG: tRNA preQ1(34) S-adenosylmethionine ribosyltransferase-isomerase QueA [Candidatus Omnitrophica bacterium]|nr:tRNA preQ1(34) S-adenosylmethionine ribosyltransferase-isomerase QueA [Candidatus Omnitrophota bacterium]